MKRGAALSYGVFCYATFVLTLAYLFGFLANVGVPKGIDAQATTSPAAAAVIDVLLLALFGLQHTIMARPGFKRWWTRLVPRPVERSTYVLVTNLVLALLFWLWQPIGGVLWNAEGGTGRALLVGLFCTGGLTVFVSTVLLNHFDLFGLRQVWLYFRGRPYTPLPFSVPFLYKYVRHPLYVGWLLAFWATPTMSAGHLLFALTATAYILIAIPIEERDLVKFHGTAYANYRRQVPMLLPVPARRGADAPSTGLQSA